MAGFYHVGDLIHAVVADVGSYSSKLGYAGDDFPKSYFRSVRRHINMVYVLMRILRFSPHSTRQSCERRRLVRRMKSPAEDL